MSVTTWIMMVTLLGICWGGFAGALYLTMRQRERRAGEAPRERGAGGSG